MTETTDQQQPCPCVAAGSPGHCADCGGYGETDGKPCPACNATGICPACRGRLLPTEGKR